MKPDVRVCADVNELSRRAAEAAVRTINDAARGTGGCSLVLSGGNTPRTLYGLLASEFRDQILRDSFVFTRFPAQSWITGGTKSL
jgi:6-phosphogluconolactonase/glucosamine-6-phosphate isomerase/deaminase